MTKLKRALSLIGYALFAYAVILILTILNNFVWLIVFGVGE